MPDRKVFLSYASADSEIALHLSSRAESNNLQAWYYERDSVPGPSYLRQIVDAIDNATAVVVIISQNSLNSTQVASEVVRSFEARKRIIALLVDVQRESLREFPELDQSLSLATLISADRSDLASAAERAIGSVLDIDASGSSSRRVSPSLLARATRISQANLQNHIFTNLLITLFALPVTSQFPVLAPVWSVLLIHSSLIGAFCLGIRYRIGILMAWCSAPAFVVLVPMDILGSQGTSRLFDEDVEQPSHVYLAAAVLILIAVSAGFLAASERRTKHSLGIRGIRTLCLGQAVLYGLVIAFALFLDFDSIAFKLFQIISVALCSLGGLASSQRRIAGMPSGLTMSLLGLSSVFVLAGGCLNVRIADTSGGVIPGAEIRVNNDVLGISDEDGQFVLPFLPSGVSSVSVHMVGFRSHLGTAVASPVPLLPSMVFLEIGDYSTTVQQDSPAKVPISKLISVLYGSLGLLLSLRSGLSRSPS